MKSVRTRHWIRSLIRSWFSPPRPLAGNSRTPYRLRIERLEDRVVPTTYTVANTLASGTGSLVAAVQNANANLTSPSLINFDPTVFVSPQTITLTTGLSLTNTTQPVTIQGPSGVTVTVSGNQQGGAQIQDFTINSGVVATIQNLTIANGNAGSNNGGGFSITAGTVTIDHCTISNNLATQGAGISVSGNAVVVLENSTITGNTASSNGAGIAFLGGTMTVLDCLFSNNTAVNNGGGAILSNSTSSLTVLDSTITGNTCHSGFGGGGIQVYNGNLILVGSTVAGNTAIGGSGGGISNLFGNSTATLINDVIWNNTATSDLDVYSGFNGAQISANYTLIGDPTGNNLNVNGLGNIIGVATTPAILGALANNGGPGQTLAPVTNSLPVGSGGNVTTANAAVSTTTPLRSASPTGESSRHHRSRRSFPSSRSRATSPPALQ